MKAGSTAHLLSEDEGRVLLRLARAGLHEHLGRRSGDECPPTSLPSRLLEPRGIFVTLTRRGRLRGCTGYVDPIRPLAEAVRELAVSSAARDRRFPPVTPDELDEIHIDLSVLTPTYRIAPEAVVIGLHGLVARMGTRSGLLLPQVAVDWGWAREQFIEHTCEKAGLPRDAWKAPGFELLAFEAQIFEEAARATENAEGTGRAP